MKLSNEALQYLRTVDYKEGEPFSINKCTLELREALKSIGFKNKSDGYISDEDLSEQLDQLKETGEYESANFLGFYISDTERMTYKYVVQVLKNGIWENERYYQDPFKYISDGCIKEISQLILTLSSGMDKYSIQVKGFKHIITKSTHETQWDIKSNCYPMCLDYVVLKLCETFMEQKSNLSIQDFTDELKKSCNYIRENIKITQGYLKLADNIEE